LIPDHSLGLDLSFEKLTSHGALLEAQINLTSIKCKTYLHQSADKFQKSSSGLMVSFEIAILLSMKICRKLFFVTAVFFQIQFSFAEPEILTWPPALRQVTSRLMKMEMKQNCRTTMADELPLLDCSYRTAPPNSRSAQVLLVDIPQTKWMDWVGNACARINKNNSNCYKKVIDQIRGQSGGQIPWSGIVYEDIKPKDGRNEAYCFRYGVSVAVKGLQRWLTRPLTEEEVRLCKESQDIIFVGVFPRPISFSLSDYTAATGKSGFLASPGVGNTLWLAEIRSVLKTSMNSKENLFINEWAKNYVK
jgi:hypothetical protein